MPRYIAFLRALNVGGHTVKMEDLRGLFGALGFERVETFIASGNVIFETRAGGDAALERKIEAHLQQALGYEVKTFVRSDAEVAAIAAYQPFKPALMKQAVALNVAFLAAALDAGQAHKLQSRFRTGIDEFHAHGRELYWLCRKKQSDSDFSNAVLERALKLRATFRGINTVHKLAAKYPPG
ncbi:MAG TPA: DUF1697 domain-containing protein [Nevskia sp.]|nr:DUF1697 domain-containing protein [Nevskia sp.]